MELIQRPRRLRGSDAVRRLCRETRLSPDSLIYPIFVDETLTRQAAHRGPARPVPLRPGRGVRGGVRLPGRRGDPLHPLRPAP